MEKELTSVKNIFLLENFFSKIRFIKILSKPSHYDKNPDKTFVRLGFRWDEDFENIDILDGTLKNLSGACYFKVSKVVEKSRVNMKSYFQIYCSAIFDIPLDIFIKFSNMY